jgi:hypothetical protein
MSVRSKMAASGSTNDISDKSNIFSKTFKNIGPLNLIQEGEAGLSLYGQIVVCTDKRGEKTDHYDIRTWLSIADDNGEGDITDDGVEITKLKPTKRGIFLSVEELAGLTSFLINKKKLTNMKKSNTQRASM